VHYLQGTTAHWELQLLSTKSVLPNSLQAAHRDENLIMLSSSLPPPPPSPTPPPPQIHPPSSSWIGEM